MHSFRKRLSEDKILLGTLLSLASPEIAEIMADSGFDWFFIDLEHSPMEVIDAQRILQATSHKVAGIIRVPLNDEIWIKKALDIGAAGVMVPLVLSAEDARRAVRYCKYPPQGTRSIGVGRAHRYGASLQQTLDTANEDVAVIIQVEHIHAVENIEDIIKVPGVDAILIGPYDLSASLGLTGKVDDPVVQEAIECVRHACLQKRLPLGIFTASAAQAKKFVSQGFSFVAVSTDTLMLVEASRNIIENVQSF
jgi:2-dehydro-3-deoxyglucarate aldolase/4-hydroxy-2-oxoheptanedioate aldolase